MTDMKSFESARQYIKAKVVKNKKGSLFLENTDKRWSWGQKYQTV